MARLNIVTTLMLSRLRAWITLAVLKTCEAGPERLTDNFSSTEHYGNRQWHSGHLSQINEPDVYIKKTVQTVHSSFVCKSQTWQPPRCPRWDSSPASYGAAARGSCRRRKASLKGSRNPRNDRIMEENRQQRVGGGGGWKVPCGDCPVPDDRVLPGSHMRQDNNEADRQPAMLQFGEEVPVENGVTSLSACVWP